MEKVQFQSMSTTVQVAADHQLTDAELKPVYHLFTMIEQTCSRFLKDSELSLLNKQIEKEVPVSDELFFILQKALQFYLETKGLFNPGILAALENNGYSQSIEKIKGREIAAQTQPMSTAARFQPFHLDEQKHTVILHTAVDLGGIAKGWVVDRAAELLVKRGYGFVNAGGDIRIFGTLPRPLNVGIEDPFDRSKMIDAIQVKSGAVATSTSVKRSWRVNGENKHHLIDPFTGKPSASSIISSTVTAPTATEADVWAKVTLLSGEEKGRIWIAHKGAKAILINKSRAIWKGEKNIANA